jgi:hypothetical protein
VVEQRIISDQKKYNNKCYEITFSHNFTTDVLITVIFYAIFRTFKLISMTINFLIFCLIFIRQMQIQFQIEDYIIQ